MKRQAPARPDSTPTTVPSSFHGMIGASPPMQAVFRYIERAAPTDATVLISGETGTGKELAARALHALSNRDSGEFIAVNCAAIPETLVEAELFGNEKGAFTGAVSKRRGLVEAADRGTLFLDEVGELPLEAQARLLRVLQEGEIRRVGATRTNTVNVRIIAATHRNLSALVQEGRFREDLYFRLNVLSIRMPPLRERAEDIPTLAESLLRQHAAGLQRPVRGFESEALRTLCRAPWRGNVRELDNVIHRACILSDSPVIAQGDLQFDGEGEAGADDGHDVADWPRQLSLEQYVEHFLLANQHHMTETEIAQNLGISRKCLWEKRQKLGIPRRQASERRGETERA